MKTNIIILLLTVCSVCNSYADAIDDYYRTIKDSRKTMNLSDNVKTFTNEYDKNSEKTFEFDKLGRIISVTNIEPAVSNPDWTVSMETKYEYTTKNKSGETICTRHGNEINGNNSIEWTYNMFGKLTTIYVGGRLIQKNSYDKKGRLVSSENSEYEKPLKDTVIYESDGGAIIKFSSGGSNKYDKYGNLLYEEDSDGIRYSSGNLSHEEYPNGSIKSLLETDSNGDTTSYCEYDKKGKITYKRKYMYIKYGYGYATNKYTYDTNGRLVEIIFYKDGVETKTRQFIYNSKEKAKSESNDPNVEIFYLEDDKYGNPLNYDRNLLDEAAVHEEVYQKFRYTYFE